MKPTVIIENEVYRKIMHWVNKSEYEVSGLGTLTVEPNGILRVKSAMLLPQKNGSTHTDIEPEDVGRLMFALREEPGDLRFWWHSHVNMAVFWSGTDLDTIKKIGAGGWFLSTVFNKKNELKSAFYAVEGTNTPWGKTELFLDDLETLVMPFHEPVMDAWDEEYRLNVTNQSKSWTSHEVTALTHYHPKLVEPDEIDDEGFTKEERSFVMMQGWTDDDITAFSDKFTPNEIMTLAEEGISGSEARTYGEAQINEFLNEANNWATDYRRRFTDELQ